MMKYNELVKGGRMVENFLLKGVLIGILFGVPIGAVGVMSMQRTLTHGIWAGIATGMGSSIADVLYASVVAFGFTFISDMLLRNQTVINIVGGSIIFIIGMNIILKKNQQVETIPKVADDVKIFLQSFVIGITNPAAILSFIFACTCFEISGQMDLFDGIQLVFGVFTGTMIWWVILAVVTNALKNKMGEQRLKNINKVFGVILIIVSIIVFIRTMRN